MKFSTGDKAVLKTSARAHTSYPVMQVVGTLNGALLLTHWGDGFDGELRHYDFYDEDKPGTRGWREGITRHVEDELYTPDEALAQIRNLEEAKSKLEDEFSEVRDLITANLKQAAELAKTASALLVKHDKSFEDIAQECGPLFKALDDGGWRHSTMVCKFGR